MRILIVGAGAIGGYVGGRLLEAGRDVTFLVRQRRAEQLRATGLIITSARDEVKLSPELVLADHLNTQYDLVILAVKAYALAGAMDDMAPAIGPSTMILPALNGMRHVDILIERFGKRTVLGGLCMIASTLDHEGRVVQLTPLHEVTFGELDGGKSDRTNRAQAVLHGCGFDSLHSADIMLEMWEKWYLLAAMGSITCLMRGSIGEVVAAPGGIAVIDALMTEILAIVSSVGRPPREAAIARVKTLLTEVGASRTSSMFRDLRDGQPIEADQIIGDLLERGQRVGIETPLLRATYASLALYQNRLIESSGHRVASTP